jgi:murein DD-endopeptidase MepM/ murein hydrolase activator NlpD
MFRRPMPASPSPTRAWIAATVVASVAALGAAAFLLVGHSERPAPPVEPIAVAVPAALPAPPAPPPERSTALSRLVGRNQNPTQVLMGLGFQGPELQAVLAALEGVLSFRRTRTTDQVRVERKAADGALRSLSWRQGPADEFLVLPCATGLCASKREVSVTRTTVRVSVVLRSSVSEALQSAGHDVGLVAAAADVLAWDVDFYQDVRVGDSLKLVVERFEADGRFLRHGEVLAAEYEGRVAGRKRLFRYTDPSGDTSYYDDAGTSARRGFLKAPVPFVHLTSRFGSRLHPLLGYVRAHQGVDYGAPEGTPVWAVGDGVVTSAGWSGGCGLAVQIHHRNGFDSMYCHLSKVNVAAGSRVGQKQVVGRVGSTGLSTGPHLHYAVRRGGSYVNPLQIQVPRGEPVRPEWRDDFVSKIAGSREQLDQVPVALLD